MKHYFVDMESLGVTDDAIILSIGMTYCDSDETVNFDQLIKRGIHIKLNRIEQQKLGRKVDKETVIWWEEQGSEAKEVLSNANVLSLENVKNILIKYLEKTEFDPKTDYFWSRGMIDSRWWEHLFKYAFDCETPVKFYKWRDTRTALFILCGDPNGSYQVTENFMKHNALHDAAMDCMRINYELSK